MKDDKENKGNNKGQEQPTEGSGSKGGNGKKGNSSECKPKPKDWTKGKGRKQDPFWYAKDDKAIANMASFPFLETVGDSIAQKDTVPIIAVAQIAHAVGTDKTFDNTAGTSANRKSRAAEAFYQYVTQGFTGGVNFEAPDLFMAAIAGASVMALLREGERAYGMTKYYIQQNKGYADGVISALGFDAKALKSGLADFRTEYNSRVAEINKIVAVPKGFSVLEEWSFCAENIFTDTSEPEWSTAYAYKVMKALRYSDTAMKTGTSLIYERVRTNEATRLTPAEFFQVIDTLINSLRSTDVRAIFGAIRRVYSDAELFKLTELNEDYLSPVVRHDVVAMQWHNMDWANYSCEGFACEEDLTDSNLVSRDKIAMLQNANGAIFAFAGRQESGTVGTHWERYLLDMYDHLVNPANVLDATNNMQVSVKTLLLDNTGDTPITYHATVCRTKFVERLVMYYYDPNPAIMGGPSSITVAKRAGSITINSATVSAPGLLTHLDSHPVLWVIGSLNGTTGVQEVVSYFGEVDKYTFLSQDSLIKLHEQCQYQLLSMPANSKSVTK